MKKVKLTLAAALLAVSGLVLAACGDGVASAPAVFAGAISSYEKAAGVRVDYTSAVTITDPASNTEVKSSGVILISRGEEDVTASLDRNASMDYGADAPIDLNVKYYYSEGNFYVEAAESKFYVPMSWEDAVRQLGPCGLLLTQFVEEDFSELLLSENADGSVRLSFVIPSAKAAALPGFEDRLLGYAGGKDADVTLRDIKGYMTLSDGQPVFQSLTLSGTVAAGEKTMTVEEVIDSTFTFSPDGSAVTPLVPAKSEFTALTK